MNRLKTTPELIPILRRGFLLWVALLVFFVLGVFVFTFNQLVVNQNIRTHHELLVQTADLLGQSSVQLIVNRFKQGLEPILRQEAPALFQPISTTGAEPKECDLSASICGQFKSEIQTFLNQLDEVQFFKGLFKHLPNCTDVRVVFRLQKSIHPTFSIQQTRDPVEKKGEMIVSCTIEFHGISRKVTATRHFSLVSMVPGPFCRFTLYAPFSPWPHCYTALGICYNGEVDTKYEHPFPQPQSFKGPLILNNSLEKFDIGKSRDDESDLQNRGWVFIGPSPDEAVFLKISNGYNSYSGGSFHFMMPPGTSPNGKYKVIPPEVIEDPSNFNQNAADFKPYLIGKQMMGFYTQVDYGNQQLGAAAMGLWDKDLWPKNGNWLSTDRWRCACSWIYPYGNMANPSRTLIIGPVLVGFLVAYFARNLAPEVTSWQKGFFSPPPPKDSYNPEDRISSVGDPFPIAFRYRSVFLQPPPPSLAQGYTSLERVSPWCSISNPDAPVPTEGIAFNTFFDFMRYDKQPDDKKPFPDYQGEPSLASAKYDQKPRCVPNSILARETNPNIPGLHPSEDVKILLPKSNTVEDTNQDQLYFHGSLREYNFPIDFGYAVGAVPRVTHILDLQMLDDADQENDRVRDFLFRPSTERDECKTGFWIPRRSGIFYILRPKDIKSGGKKMVLPKNIFLDKSLMIVSIHGDMLISGDITTSLPETGGIETPPKGENLLSLIPLDGDIYLGPEAKKIHAYLAPIGPGREGGAGGNRLLADQKPFSNKLDIFGGLAAWEIGLYKTAGEDPRDCGTTMNSFPKGGMITYNPYFNPSAPTYEESRKLIVDDLHIEQKSEGAQ